MITPRFKASQDKDFVLLTIDAPYVKFSDGEMVLNGNEFTFYCKPYFLKLFFSGHIVENGSEHASYSIDEGTFTIKLPKLHQGETFENLDMLSSLMTSRQGNAGGPLIEVLGSDAATSTEPTDGAPVGSVLTEPDGPGDASPIAGLAACRYGFNNKTSGLFTKRPEEALELIDIPSPDSTPPQQRCRLQAEREARDFSADHYLADLVEDEPIEEILSQSASPVCGDTLSDGFTKSEQDTLVSLPKKEYLMDSLEKRSALLGLVDILFAYLYEGRTTGGEWSVESAWTIRKLSSLLSCLNCGSCLRSVLISSVRRSLCYPLYRHWALSMKIIDDLVAALSRGKMAVVKCLLHIRELFNSSSDCYYLLNELYVTDYCVWVQSVDDGSLSSLAQLVERDVKLSKLDAGLLLDDVERQLLTDDAGHSESVDNTGSSCSESDDDSLDSDDSDDDDDDDDDDDNEYEAKGKTVVSAAQPEASLPPDTASDVLTAMSSMTLEGD